MSKADINKANLWEFQRLGQLEKNKNSYIQGVFTALFSSLETNSNLSPPLARTF